jgi:MYXO-CTERM domain-containing protein
MQVELPVAPPIGHIAKDPAGNPAGCNVGDIGTGSHAWMLALLLLAPLLRRRKA